MNVDGKFIFMFFIYGLSFFTMGLAALIQNRDKNSEFPLERAVSYLGLFGIVHGFTEWMIMLRITNLYPLYESRLLNMAIFFNGISFVFLWLFGIKLLERDYRVKAYTKILPFLAFAIWVLGSNFSYWIFKEDIISRYFIGFPGAMTTAFALGKNANYKRNLKLNYLYLRLKVMSIAFFIYGVLAGLVVDNMGRFPSTLINKQKFYNIFGFPVELGRTILAIIITLLFLNIMKRFQWITNKKGEELMRYKIVNDERKRIVHELHDITIQNLFASGLELESLIVDERDPAVVEELENIKVKLNTTIIQIRDFINEMESEKIQFEDLKFKITELIEGIRNKSNIEINIMYKVTGLTLGTLSQEKISQIYYIIQESLYNAVRHSKGSKITIEVFTTLDSVVIKIKDNGIGFEPLEIFKGNHYGLNIMKERAEIIKGTLDIKSNKKGTLISVIVPWEEAKYGGKEF